MNIKSVIIAFFREGTSRHETKLFLSHFWARTARDCSSEEPPRRQLPQELAFLILIFVQFAFNWSTSSVVSRHSKFCPLVGEVTI
jgi:hypothetical protein